MVSLASLSRGPGLKEVEEVWAVRSPDLFMLIFVNTGVWMCAVSSHVAEDEWPTHVSAAFIWDLCHWQRKAYQRWSKSNVPQPSPELGGDVLLWEFPFCKTHTHTHTFPHSNSDMGHSWKTGFVQLGFPYPSVALKDFQGILVNQASNWELPSAGKMRWR